jgi:beta-lactamase regulating signal transducer with metallopeptidase domain
VAVGCGRDSRIRGRIGLWVFVRLVCVCVIVYFLEKMFLAIQKYYVWFLSHFSSLTSDIIKSSCINYTLLIL